MDNFKEQLVEKIPTRADKTTKVMIMVFGFLMGIIIMVLSFFYIPALMLISLCLGGGIVYGAFWLSQKYDVEYEYIFTNGEIDIDKIEGRRNRKRLVTLDVKKATDFGVADDSYAVPDENTLVLATSGEDGTVEYYVEANHKSLGKTTLIFTPDEEMLQLVKDALPVKIAKQNK